MYLLRRLFCLNTVHRSVVILLICLMPGSGLCPSAQAEERFDEYQVKSAFLFNLANFIHWPNESFASSDSPFIITILGETPLTENLENIIQGEKIDSHPIVVREIEDIQDIENPHILFVAQGLRDQTYLFSPELTLFGTLTVSDDKDFSEKGGAVTLYVEDNRIALKLNVASTERAGLRVSSKLLRLAQIVVGAAP